ncbi:MAG: hydantoinase B/oxoprolinase family protein, partial [Alphaproteobacteria bacterium]|nr:hydantoinase B/oxoprolinase family protein [Alphaproteobacteria bacterium]
MIQAQIVYSKLHAIATELGERLRCSARSPRIAEDRAFATAVLTGDLRLAVQTQGEANHLFALRASVRSLFDYFAFDLAEGDVLAVADPYHGGTDSHTLTLAVPVFHGGDLVLFPAVRAPLIDLAGEFPGDLHPSAFEVWQESIR